MAKDTILKDMYRTGDIISFRNSYMYGIPVYVQNATTIRGTIMLEKPIVQTGWHELAYETSGDTSAQSFWFHGETGLIRIPPASVSVVNSTYYPVGIGLQIVATSNLFEGLVGHGGVLQLPNPMHITV